MKEVFPVNSKIPVPLEYKIKTIINRKREYYITCDIHNYIDIFVWIMITMSLSRPSYTTSFINTTVLHELTRNRL